MKWETSRKFWDCTIIAYSFRGNGFIIWHSFRENGNAYKMAQPSEKFRCKKSMACPYFLYRLFSNAVQTSMKAVVEVYGDDFFHAVEYANKIVRQIKEWCFFWSVSLRPTKRNSFPHAVLLRQERVACHCFMSFGLCDKNGTANCGYKSLSLSAQQTKKSPWQYSLEDFQGIPQRIFLAVP